MAAHYAECLPLSDEAGIRTAQLHTFRADSP